MSKISEALRALAYTQGVLGRVPANHPAREAATHGLSTVCVDMVRDRYRRDLDSERIMNIRRQAGAAKRLHCGNCGEYAAVAFDFLMLSQCTYPVEFAGYVRPGDHAFVIVGRPANTDEADPDSWGEDVVICDAWAGKVVPSRSYWSAMPPYPHRVHAPTVDARWPVAGDYPSGRAVGIPA